MTGEEKRQDQREGKPERRLQSAIEYITIYGWAILILAIALAVIFYLNLFNSNSYVSTQCVLSQGFACQNVYLAGNGLLTLQLLQSTSDPVNITGIGCNQNGSITNIQVPLNLPTNQLYMPVGSSSTFYIHCYTNSNTIVTSSTVAAFNGSIIINYTDELTGLRGTSSGKLVTKITP